MITVEKRVFLSSEATSPAGQTPPRDEELESWVRIALDAGQDKLGTDAQAYFVGEIMGITEWFVVISGSNVRQVRAITESVEEQLTVHAGLKPTCVEGTDTYSWVLMDFGAFVVHVFTSDAREFYDLDRLWSDVPRLIPAS